MELRNRLVRSGERRTEPRTRRSRQERVRLTHAAIGHNRGFSADSASSALIVIVMAWQAARKFASAVAAWQRNLRIIQAGGANRLAVRIAAHPRPGREFFLTNPPGRPAARPF